MLPSRRRETIVRYLAENGSSTIGDLSELCSVSEMTIRRDLAELQRRGLLKRVYGGATATEAAFFEFSLAAKMAQMSDEKVRIGSVAASMIPDGAVVLISGGSTTIQVARHIKANRVTVITNGLNIASELVSNPQVELFMVGGLLLKETGNLVGPQADAFLNDVRADMFFMGVEGIDQVGGITLPDVVDAQTNRAMMKCARKVIVVADHTKLGRNALIKVAPISDAHVLITDGGARQDIIEQLRKHTETVVV